MHPALQHNLFLVKEHVGVFKAANNCDVYDSESGTELLWCREPKLGSFTKILRFTKYKTMTPFNIAVTTPDGDPVLHIRRGVSLSCRFRTRRRRTARSASWSWPPCSQSIWC